MSSKLKSSILTSLGIIGLSLSASAFSANHVEKPLNQSDPTVTKGAAPNFPKPGTDAKGMAPTEGKAADATGGEKTAPIKPTNNAGSTVTGAAPTTPPAAQGAAPNYPAKK